MASGLIVRMMTMAKAQTLATEKYRKKAGIITKTFKLKKDLCDQYAAACTKVGKSQTEVIQMLMQKFIDENK